MRTNRKVIGVVLAAVAAAGGLGYALTRPARELVVNVTDPLACGVHGFKNLVLKNTGLMAVSDVIAFLLVFTTPARVAATLLFRRTL